MALECQNCGTNEFRLRRTAGGPEAQCVKCGAIIPNSALRAVNAISTPSESDKRNQIQLAAGEMTRLYGKDAARQAAKRAGDALSKGDLEQTNIWLAVIGTLVGNVAPRPSKTDDH
jgi:uncharacterized Zn finger protein